MKDGGGERKRNKERERERERERREGKRRTLNPIVQAPPQQKMTTGFGFPSPAGGGTLAQQ